jgi:O-antigen/teichoic acid export membrane protein
MKYSWFAKIMKRVGGRSQFVNHIFTLMAGAVITQVISILAAPVLTRLYSPAEFGAFALYISVANVFGVIITGRYHLAIMLPEKDEEAVNVMALTILIVTCVSLGLFIVALFFGDFIGQITNNLIGDLEIKILPVAVFFAGLYQVQTMWLNRNLDYKIVSLSKINQSIFNTCLTIIFSLIGITSVGFVLGDFFGYLAAIAVGFLSVKRGAFVLIESICYTEIKRVSKKYAVFPTINMLHALGDMVQASSVTFIISMGFGSATLGFYAFGIRVLRAPMGIIGSSISQVFYQKLIRLHNENNYLRPVLNLMVKRLLIFAFLPFLIIFLFSKHIFLIVFGLSWTEAGAYVQVLSPWLYLNFVASSISQVPIILGRQKEVFKISIVGNSVMFLIFAVGAYCKYEIIMVLVCVSIFMSFYTIFVINWTLKISDANA